MSDSSFFFAGQQYCWSDTASCISETASTTILPNHLRSTDITSSKTRPTSGNLETASAVASASAVGRKSYNNLKTTHYGLIDWPSPKAVLATSNEKREVFLKNWINRLIESIHFLCFRKVFYKPANILVDIHMTFCCGNISRKCIHTLAEGSRAEATRSNDPRVGSPHFNGTLYFRMKFFCSIVLII